MSIRRYQLDGRPLDKHRSIETPTGPQQPYCLKRYNRSRNRVNTKSLQSIELRPNPTLIPTKSTNRRRKLFSYDRHEQTELDSERNTLQQSVRQLPSAQLKPPLKSMRTIEGGSLEEKERQIKNCIQLMQGVLSEIQNQKVQKASVVLKAAPQPQPQPQPQLAQQSEAEAKPDVSTDQTMQIKSSEEGSMSKFQSYVRKVCNLRQDSKVIILRKAKTKSLINSNSIVRSTAILNFNKLDSIREAKPKEITPYDPKKRRQRPYFGGGGIEELECSSIEAATNQSSFISSMGKEALMRQLEDQREKTRLDPSSKGVHRLKNHRKLKNIFPDDFF